MSCQVKKSLQVLVLAFLLIGASACKLTKGASSSNLGSATTTSNTEAPSVSPSSPVTLNLHLLLQGYYLSGGTMQAVLMNQGVGSDPRVADHITVELHHASTYATVATASATLSINGTTSVTFPDSVPPGNYYIAVLHRNSIQTWSASAIEFKAGSNSYDFTSAANRAYGSNMIEVESGVWAFYTGDINQDLSIDVLDFPELDSDMINFAEGYYKTDLNGDGFVEALDLPILNNNNTHAVFAITPLN